MPRLRRTTSPSAKSPLASTSAFLHSIMPAPVRSRSSFTSAAVISIIEVLPIEPITLVSAFGRRRFRNRVGGLPNGGPPAPAPPPRPPAPGPPLPRRTRTRFGGLRSGTLALLRRLGRLAFQAQALRHDLLGVLGVNILGVVRHAFFGGRLVLNDLVGGEVLLGGQRAALDHRVGDLAGKQTDGA